MLVMVAVGEAELALVTAEAMAADLAPVTAEDMALAAVPVTEAVADTELDMGEVMAVGAVQVTAAEALQVTELDMEPAVGRGLAVAAVIQAAPDPRAAGEDGGEGTVLDINVLILKCQIISFILFK